MERSRRRHRWHGTGHAPWAFAMVAWAALVAEPAWSHQGMPGRGAYQIGATANYARTSGPSRFPHPTTNLIVNTSLRRFLTRYLAIGADASLWRVTSGGSATTTADLGPGLACYLPGADLSVHPYLSLTGLFGRAATPAVRRAYRGYRGAAGALALLNPHVGLSGEVYRQVRRDRLTYTANNDSPRFTATTVGFAAGLCIFL